MSRASQRLRGLRLRSLSDGSDVRVRGISMTRTLALTIGARRPHLRTLTVGGPVAGPGAARCVVVDALANEQRHFSSRVWLGSIPRIRQRKS